MIKNFSNFTKNEKKIRRKIRKMSTKITQIGEIQKNFR